MSDEGLVFPLPLPTGTGVGGQSGSLPSPPLALKWQESWKFRCLVVCYFRERGSFKHSEYMSQLQSHFLHTANHIWMHLWLNSSDSLSPWCFLMVFASSLYLIVGCCFFFFLDVFCQTFVMSCRLNFTGSTIQMCNCSRFITMKMEMFSWWATKRCWSPCRFLWVQMNHFYSVCALTDD